MEKTKVRKDIMSTNFPSIWLETNETGQKPIVICGCYRVWTNDGTKTMEEQIKNLEILNQQIVNSSDNAKSVIMMGDVNLCSHKYVNYTFSFIKVQYLIE